MTLIFEIASSKVFVYRIASKAFAYQMIVLIVILRSRIISDSRIVLDCGIVSDLRLGKGVSVVRLIGDVSSVSRAVRSEDNCVIDHSLQACWIVLFKVP